MAPKKKATQKSSEKPATVPLQPLSDRVVIRPLSPEEMGTKTASGIIIPETEEERMTRGIVVAVGPGKYDDGELVPMSVNEGDRVLFNSKYDSVSIAGTQYFVISESNILAIIT